MEAVGAALAVTSLTLQLVDGVERFRAFLEEYKDPLVDITDLVGQLNAIQLLLEIIDKDHARPGSNDELSSSSCLRDEITKSRARLQQLANLVAHFEAQQSPDSRDPQKNKSTKRRVKNYLVLYSQQKKINRLAGKLDRTRTAVVDHLHIALLTNVSAIRTDQVTAMSQRAKYTPVHHDDPIAMAHQEKNCVADQNTLVQIAAQFKYPNVTSSASAPAASTAAAHARSSSCEFEIVQEGGTLHVRNFEKMTVHSASAGSKLTLFKSNSTTQCAPRRAQKTQAQSRPEVSSENRASPADLPSSKSTYRSHGNKMSIHSTNGARTKLDNGNEVTLLNHAGEAVMFDDEERYLEQNDEVPAEGGEETGGVAIS